jgi:hypothetical protein
MDFSYDRAYRAQNIKMELESLSQDIIQDLVGEIVPDIETRKARFFQLHNELRTILGKEPRYLK